jgi:hypothetical protein
MNIKQNSRSVKSEGNILHNHQKKLRADGRVFFQLYIKESPMTSTRKSTEKLAFSPDFFRAGKPLFPYLIYLKS